MAKTSEQTKKNAKKKEVEQEEAQAPEVPEESKEPEKAAEELDEKEILEEPEEEIETEKVEESKKDKAEEDIVEERIYTIPLGRAWISPRQKRAPRAVRMIQAFIQRHMKPAALVISNEVNDRIWSRGIRKPPRRIRVRAARDTDGTVTLYLAEGD